VAGVDEESTSGSTSSGDRLREEARTKSREDSALRSTTARVEGGKGKGVDLEDSVGEYVVRHRCVFEAICGLVEEISDAQKEAVRGTVWWPVLEYKKFVMDRHRVQALIQTWNPDSTAFRVGRREVPFTYFDVALLTGLPAMGRQVVFHRGEAAGKVEQLVMTAIEERLHRERQRRRVDRMESRIYRKLFSLLVLSGLYFP